MSPTNSTQRCSVKEQDPPSGPSGRRQLPLAPLLSLGHCGLQEPGPHNSGQIGQIPGPTRCMSMPDLTLHSTLPASRSRQPAPLRAQGKSKAQSLVLLSLTALIGRTQPFSSWGNFSILSLSPRCRARVCVFPKDSHSKTISSATAFPPSFFPGATRMGKSGSPPRTPFPLDPGTPANPAPKTNTPTGHCLVLREKEHTRAAFW